jgi:hypothetical protein
MRHTGYARRANCDKINQSLVNVTGSMRAQKRAQTNVEQRHRKLYAESEKLQAVTIALAHDYPTSAQSLEDVQQALGQPISLAALDRWVRDYGDRVREAKRNNELIPAPKDTATLVAETHNSVVSRMQNLLSLYLDAAGDEAKIQGASLRDLNIGIGVQFDKLKQAAGISPEIERALKVLEAACRPLGVEPVDAILDLAQVYRAQAKQHSENAIEVVKDDEK